VGVEVKVRVRVRVRVNDGTQINNQLPSAARYN
jgi:hypothetical protein